MYGYKETSRIKNSSGIDVSQGITTLDTLFNKSISGGGGRGPLPSGLYKLMPAYIIDPSHDHYQSYCRDGIAFFAPLIPQFQTDRTNLGVHPVRFVDNSFGSNGTLGCCGQEENIQESWYILSKLTKEGVDFLVIMLGGK